MNFDNQYRPGGFAHLPVVTKNLLIVNVLTFAATVILKKQGIINMVDYLGLHYHMAEHFKPHQFITYMFMHGDLGHLFFNMFGVFIFGQVLEDAWGAKRYLIFYIACGLGAAAAHYGIMHYEVSKSIAEFEMNNPTITEVERAQEFARYAISLNRMVVIGASGSLFGLLGGFGMLYPNRLVYVYFMIPLKAKWLVTIYAAAELFYGIGNRPGDNVAHFAHIGGLVTGLIIVLIWRQNRERFY